MRRLYKPTLMRVVLAFCGRRTELKNVIALPSLQTAALQWKCDGSAAL